jgi:hypothetical protein
LSHAETTLAGFVHPVDCTVGVCCCGPEQSGHGTRYPLPVASDDAALRALADQFFAAYSQKDLAAITALWSSHSPEMAAQQKSIEQFFAANDKIEIRDVTIQQLKVDGNNARFGFDFDLSAIDVKTGGAADGLGKAARNSECVEEDSAWGIRREGDTAEDMAALLVAAKSEQDRAASARSSAEARYTPQNVAGAQTTRNASNLSTRRPRLKHRLENSKTTVRKP